MRNRLIAALFLMSFLLGGLYASSSALGHSGPGSSPPYTMTGHPWHIKQTTAPAWLSIVGDFPDSPPRAMSTFFVGQCTGSGCPDAGSEGSFNSDWSYVKCQVDALPSDVHRYYMSFDATKDNWPSTWPASVKCTRTVEGITFTITVPIANEVSAWDRQSGPVSFTGTWTLEVDESELVTRSSARPLPATGSYTSANPIQCKKSGGSDWTGVRAAVQDNGSNTDWMTVRVDDGADECLTGCYCPITHSSGTKNIKVKLDHL